MKGISKRLSTAGIIILVCTLLFALLAGGITAFAAFSAPGTNVSGSSNIDTKNIYGNSVGATGSGGRAYAYKLNDTRTDKANYGAYYRCGNQTDSLELNSGSTTASNFLLKEEHFNGGKDTLYSRNHTVGTGGVINLNPDTFAAAHLWMSMVGNNRSSLADFRDNTSGNVIRISQGTTNNERNATICCTIKLDSSLINSLKTTSTSGKKITFTADVNMAGWMGSGQLYMAYGEPQTDSGYGVGYFPDRFTTVVGDSTSIKRENISTSSYTANTANNRPMKDISGSQNLSITIYPHQLAGYNFSLLRVGVYTYSAGDLGIQTGNRYGIGAYITNPKITISNVTEDDLLVKRTYSNTGGRMWTINSDAEYTGWGWDSTLTGLTDNLNLTDRNMNRWGILYSHNNSRTIAGGAYRANHINTRGDVTNSTNFWIMHFLTIPVGDVLGKAIQDGSVNLTFSAQGTKTIPTTNAGTGTSTEASTATANMKVFVEAGYYVGIGNTQHNKHTNFIPHGGASSAGVNLGARVDNINNAAYSSQESTYRSSGSIGKVNAIRVGVYIAKSGDNTVLCAGITNMNLKITDVKGPTAKVTYNGVQDEWSTSKSATVALSDPLNNEGTGAGKGVNASTIKQTAGGTGATISGASATGFTVTATAPGTFTFTVSDNANNVTTIVLNFSYIDTHAPTITATAVDNNAYAIEKSTTLTFLDSLGTASGPLSGSNSGIKWIKLKTPADSDFVQISPSKGTVGSSLWEYTITTMLNGVYQVQVCDMTDRIVTKSDISIFRVLKEEITLEINSPISGVTLTANGFALGGIFTGNTTVNLVANQILGYYFAGWTVPESLGGGISQSLTYVRNTDTLTTSQGGLYDFDHTFIANYERIDKPSVQTLIYNGEVQSYQGFTPPLGYSSESINQETAKDARVNAYMVRINVLYGAMQEIVGHIVEPLLIITPKDLCVTTVVSNHKIYGDDTLPVISYLYDSFAAGEDETYLNSAGLTNIYSLNKYTPVGTISVSTVGYLSNNYNISYMPASFDIHQRPITVTPTAAQKEYDGLLPSVINYTLSEAVYEEDNQISGSLTLDNYRVGSHLILIGDFKITSLTGDVSNYSITLADVNYEINPIVVNIEILQGQSKFYDGITALSIVYTILSVSNPAFNVTTEDATGSLEIENNAVNQGTYSVKVGTLSFDDSIYKIVFSETTFKINKKPITITPTVGQFKFYDATEEVDILFTHTALVGTDTFSGKLSVSGKNAGIYPILLGSLSLSDNYEIILHSTVFEIKNATLTITAQDKTREYGNANPQFTVKSFDGYIGDEEMKFDSPLVFTVLDGDGNAVEPWSPIGVYEIVISGGYIQNYDLVYISGTFTITKRTLTITAIDSQKTYGNLNPNFYATYSGFMTGDNISVLDGELKFSTDVTLFTAVGDYDITPYGFTSENYNINFVKGKLTVNPYEIKIVFTDTEQAVYNGFVQSITAKPLLTLNGDIVNLTLTEHTNFIDAGNHQATVTGIDNANYKLPATGLTAGKTVTAKDLTVTVDNYQRFYGDANPAITAENLLFDGLCNLDNYASMSGSLVISTAAVESTKVGNYEISADGLTSANYNITFLSGTLTINRRPIEITSLSFQKDFDGISLKNIEGFEVTNIKSWDLEKNALGIYSIFNGAYIFKNSLDNQISLADVFNADIYSVVFIDEYIENYTLLLQSVSVSYTINRITVSVTVDNNKMPFIGQQTIVPIDFLACNFTIDGQPVNTELSSYILSLEDLITFGIADASGNMAVDPGSGYFWKLLNGSNQQNFTLLFNDNTHPVSILSAALTIKFTFDTILYDQMSKLNDYLFIDEDGFDVTLDYKAIKNMMHFNLIGLSGEVAGEFGNIGSYYLYLVVNNENISIENTVDGLLYQDGSPFVLTINPAKLEIDLNGMLSDSYSYGIFGKDTFSIDFSALDPSQLNELAIFSQEIANDLVNNTFSMELYVLKDGVLAENNISGYLSIGSYSLVYSVGGFAFGNYIIETVVNGEFEINKKELTLAFEYSDGIAFGNRSYQVGVFDANDLSMYLLNVEGLAFGETLGSYTVSVVKGSLTAQGYQFTISYTDSLNIENGTESNYSYSPLTKVITMLRINTSLNINLEKVYSDINYTVKSAVLTGIDQENLVEVQKAYIMDMGSGFYLLTHTTPLKNIECGTHLNIFTTYIVEGSDYYNVTAYNVTLNVKAFTISNLEVNFEIGFDERIEYLTEFSEFKAQILESIEEALLEKVLNNSFVIDSLLSSLVFKLGQEIFEESGVLPIGITEVYAEFDQDNIVFTTGVNLLFRFNINKILITSNIFTNSELKYDGQIKLVEYTLSNFKELPNETFTSMVRLYKSDGETFKAIGNMVDAGIYRASLLTSHSDYYELTQTSKEFHIEKRQLNHMNVQTTSYTGEARTAVVSFYQEAGGRQFSLNNYTVKYYLDGVETVPILANTYTVVVTSNDQNFLLPVEGLSQNFIVAKTTRGIDTFIDVLSLEFNNLTRAYDKTETIPNMFNLTSDHGLSYTAVYPEDMHIVNAGVYYVDFVISSPNFQNSYVIRMAYIIEKSEAVVDIINNPLSSYEYSLNRASGIDYQIKVLEFAGGSDITSKTQAVYRNSYGTVITLENVKNKGAYTLTISLTDDNVSMETIVFAFEITAKELTVNAKEFIASYVYSGEVVSPILYTMDNNTKIIPQLIFERYNKSSYQSLATAPKDAGIYRVKTLIQDPAGNYLLTGQTVFEFIIEKKQVIITASDLVHTYDGEVKNAIYSIYGLVTADTDKEIDIISRYYKDGMEVLSIKDVGSYKIDISISDTNYYVLETVIDFRINGAKFDNVTLNSEKYTYDGKEKNLTLSVNTQAKGFSKDKVKITWNYTLEGRVVTRPTNVGKYTVTVTLEQTGFEKYTITATLEIMKAEIKISYTKTQGVLTVQPIESAMYRINGGEWQTTNVFYNIKDHEEYFIEVKIADENLAQNYVVPEDNITLEGQSSSFVVYIILPFALLAILIFLSAVFKKRR